MAHQLPISKSAMRKLGQRLASGSSSDDDERELQIVLGVYDEALADVAGALRAIGLDPTSRLKNRSTIIEKIQRDHSHLARIRDIAGCRVVLDGGRAEQDVVVTSIGEGLHGRVEVIDRRANPSHGGYRAVHLEVDADGIPVEVQVRTVLQHLWAEVFEKLGDRFGRWIRYRDEPRQGEFSAEVELLPDVRQLVTMLSQLAGSIENVERNEELIAPLRALDHSEFDATDSQQVARTLAEFVQQLDAARAELQSGLAQMRERLRRQDDENGTISS